MDPNILLHIRLPPPSPHFRNAALAHPEASSQILGPASPTIPTPRRKNPSPLNSNAPPSNPHALYRAHRRFLKFIRRIQFFRPL